MWSWGFQFKISDRMASLLCILKEQTHQFDNTRQRGLGAVGQIENYFCRERQGPQKRCIHNHSVKKDAYILLVSSLSGQMPPSACLDLNRPLKLFQLNDLHHQFSFSPVPYLLNSWCILEAVLSETDNRVRYTPWDWLTWLNLDPETVIARAVSQPTLWLTINPLNYRRQSANAIRLNLINCCPANLTVTLQTWTHIKHGTDAGKTNLRMLPHPSLNVRSWQRKCWRE